MNTDFQTQLTKSILLLTPGMLLLGLLGVLGLLMMLEKLGLLGSSTPPAAPKPADTAAPASTPPANPTP